jgi:hypothetical protein
MDPRDAAFFRTFGFLVLRNHFSHSRLRVELEGALAGTSEAPIATGVASVRYAPMMTQRTPHSLALLDALEPVATALLNASVLPVRAKGMSYFGSTRWHCDSTSSVPSLGFAAYLEPLNAENGALRVLPASHQPECGDSVAQFLAGLDADSSVSSLPAFAIATSPGDVIALDEHLYHASVGGEERLQWRVDYVRAPTTEEGETEVRRYFARVFDPGWDGGHDPDAAPSYDADWLASGRPAVDELRRLGVYELANAQEAVMRSRRRPRLHG